MLTAGLEECFVLLPRGDQTSQNDQFPPGDQSADQTCCQCGKYDQRDLLSVWEGGLSHDQ